MSENLASSVDEVTISMEEMARSIAGVSQNAGRIMDETAVALDDADDRRQAESGAFSDLLGGEERVEDFVHRLRRHAAAGVGNAKRHMGAQLRAGVHAGEMLINDEVL